MAPGGVRERPNRHAWRACVEQSTVGSNPTPSAERRSIPQWEGGPVTLSDAEAMGLALDEARAALEHDDVPVTHGVRAEESTALLAQFFSARRPAR